MTRARRLSLLGLGVLLLASVAIVLPSTNYARTRTSVRFQPGANGLNELHVLGPAGRIYVVYSVVAQAGGKLAIGSHVAGRLPIFGADTSSASSDFPRSGETTRIETGEHVKIADTFALSAATAVPTEGNRDRVGTWILVTDDPAFAPGGASLSTLLATAAPALGTAPLPPRPPADERVAQLVAQLRGTGPVLWDRDGQPQTLTSWNRRNHELHGRVDAAHALATLGAVARPAIPALVETLAVPDHDTGDGIISFRTAAAAALGDLAPIDSSAEAALVRLSTDASAHARLREAATTALETLRVRR